MMVHSGCELTYLRLNSVLEIEAYPMTSIIKAVPVIDSPDKGEQKRSIASGKYIYL